MWKYDCRIDDCKMKGYLPLEGGFVAERISGYCTTCRSFVHLAWKRAGAPASLQTETKGTALPASPPKPLGTVWNIAAGHESSLYACPTCEKPFLEISRSDLHTVPKKVAKLMLSIPREADVLATTNSLELERFLATLGDRRDTVCPSCTNLTLTIKYAGAYD